MKSISAYTTTRNVVSMDYPFKQSIESMLQFADEICVFDTSDGSDNTREELQKLQTLHPRIKVEYADYYDWSAPNHGVFDGQAKAASRCNCTGDVLWQFDIDEVVHEDHAPLIRPLVESIDFTKTPLVALPVAEYWGNTGKIRLDVNLWKWRLSLNHPEITHGIPRHLRKIENGLIYAKPGTDGCDYIHIRTHEIIPCVSLVPMDLNNTAHYLAKTYNEPGLKMIKSRFDEVLGNTPGVFHYSWFNIERKIKQYKQFWTGFWPSLYNEQRDERSNPFFPGMLWADVTDQMIKDKAKLLEEGCTGHIFHTPWNGTPSYGINVKMNQPLIMKDWK